MTSLVKYDEVLPENSYRFIGSNVFYKRFGCDHLCSEIDT